MKKMGKNRLTRRSFIEKSAVTAGIAAFGTLGIQGSSFAQQPGQEKLPREVWVASVSQMNLSANTPAMMAQNILDILDESLVYQPDIVCLPETFLTYHVNQEYTLNEKVALSLKALDQFSDFSKKNSCYMVCPVCTSENGKIYNSAVIFNRQGENIGEYRKIHLTEGEISKGISPGPLQPPVFKTDFGIIGVQICFDIEWNDGWKKLREQGAEIVFWPSAFAGGQKVNTKAWQNKYVVVSSTRKNTSKICDISGDVISETGIWNKNLVCAPVNLEKAFLHLWPYVKHFKEIRKKYGRKVRITIYHEEEWAIFESLSPDIYVKDILNEFDMKTHEELTSSAEIAQNKARK